MVVSASRADVTLSLFDHPQGLHWKCELPLTNAKMWFDPGCTAGWGGWAEKECHSVLRITYSDGTELILGERTATVH